MSDRANSRFRTKGTVRGRLIEPGDTDYDEARKLCNGMIHKKPRLIARCTGVADVIRSVNFGRENDLLVSIRGSGHNAGGLGICDDGLVIDLSSIKYTRVDPVARTVTGGGGNTWGDVGPYDRLVQIKNKYDPDNFFRVTKARGIRR
jgi:FAD/FMN-containing dehydrogenase